MKDVQKDEKRIAVGPQELLENTIDNFEKICSAAKHTGRTTKMCESILQIIETYKGDTVLRILVMGGNYVFS